MPKPEDANSNVIIIKGICHIILVRSIANESVDDKGYEEKAILAKEAILKMVQDLDDLVKQDLPIDRRVHSRLIGRRGRTIRQIMDQFKVEIRFPSEGNDPDLVTIIGPEEKVQECSDYLLNMVEEYVSSFLTIHNKLISTLSITFFFRCKIWMTMTRLISIYALQDRILRRATAAVDNLVLW